MQLPWSLCAGEGLQLCPVQMHTVPDVGRKLAGRLAGRAEAASQGGRLNPAELFA